MAKENENSDQLLEAHASLIREALSKNVERINTTKQVIEQYEHQKEFLAELPKTLSTPVLVPVGVKGFFRGNLVHTNEILQNIGCGYIVKRTARQAIESCDRMISETTKFLTKLYDEEKWLDGQIKVPSKENAFSSSEQIEIIETFDEKAEAEWRKKHRESVKAMKQEEAKTRNESAPSEQDIFSILDVLELQEELEQAQAELAVEERKTEIHEQLEKLRENKTTIKTADDVIKRLDELEKEEMLLDEIELMSLNDDSGSVETTTTESPEKNVNSSEKPTTIRFKDEVETKLYDSNKAVVEDSETNAEAICDPKPSTEDDEPATLTLRFSHSANVPTYSETPQDEIDKPSDLYSMPYRPKSILKNKNRIFDEPQHSGEFSEPMMHAPLKKRERVRDRNWVCYDTFPKNGGDLYEENTHVPVPTFTEVKEKAAETVDVSTASAVVEPPKKRQSRFSVSRALLTKK